VTWASSDADVRRHEVLRLRKPLSVDVISLHWRSLMGCPALRSKTSIRRGHFSPPEIDQRGVQYHGRKAHLQKNVILTI
jgi:hypothetical protein